AFTRDARAARRAERRERIVVDLAAGDDRYPFVEQIHEPAQNPALRLTTEPEEDEVVPGKDRVHELRDDRLVVADDAGEKAVAGLQLAHQVVTDFLLDRPRMMTRLAEFAEGGDGR